MLAGPLGRAVRNMSIAYPDVDLRIHEMSPDRQIAMLKAGRTSVLRLPHTVGPGGVPIIVGGSCVGAVGVSGAPPHIDIELAEAAVAAFVSRHSDK